MPQSPTHDLLTRLIKEVREDYICDERADSFFCINNGLCADLADDVLDRLSQVLADNGADQVECDNYRVPGDDFLRPWDTALLERQGIRPPVGFTWDDLNAIDFGFHVWIAADGLHYDAECPNGVTSFFELPIFRRYLLVYGRSRGMMLPEVIVDDDVEPSPLCPVPMPR